MIQFNEKKINLFKDERSNFEELIDALFFDEPQTKFEDFPRWQELNEEIEILEEMLDEIKLNWKIIQDSFIIFYI